MRIVKGENARRHQFPYLVSLEYIGKHICGGGILTQTWIISAAHCVQKFDIKRLSISAGVYLLGEDHEDIQKCYVKDVVIHPRYQTSEQYLQKYDLALLNFKNPLVFTVAVKPLLLPEPTQRLSGTFELAGWGYIDTNPKKTNYHITVPSSESIED
ncbi:hypothetical protein ILUMI_08031 [Ignelater luminosus]|uniref:Peptidase S1 domain-containing protein n=1 Tax=Ignelater luminosus TaxID=2038154 RepID=A0A8K0D749_IGNLU|nr:hypothetical protein ILUMI_08031 [Ignelater luminosus]